MDGYCAVVTGGSSPARTARHKNQLGGIGATSGSTVDGGVGLNRARAKGKKLGPKFSNAPA